MFCCHERKETITKPPNPSDIIWENLDVPDSKRLGARLIIYLISIVILCISGIVIYYLRKAQENDTSVQGVIGLLVATIPSFVVLIFNLILEGVMGYLTTFELHISFTNYNYSVGIKLIALMFMNTAIIPTIVNLLIIDDVEDWFKPGGFCTDIYLLMLINTVFPPLFYFWTFNPLYILRYCCCKKRVQKKLLKGELLPQEEVNDAYTPLEIQLQERYANVIKILYVGLFFSPLVPMSIFIALVGIALEYLVTKYMILKKHPKPKEHNEVLALGMVRLVKFSIVVYGAGVIYLFSKLNSGLEIYILIPALLLTTIGIFYPASYWVFKTFHQNLMDKVFESFPEGNIKCNYRMHRLSLLTVFFI